MFEKKKCREVKEKYKILFRSTVGTMFALPWYLTWFGHSLNQYRDVVRLYDFFLASPPLMPLYVAAALVLRRSEEIFEVGCDMAMVHCLLSQIPDETPFEEILKKASKLYDSYPPDKIEKSVNERIRREYVYLNYLNVIKRLTNLLHILRRLFSFHYYYSFFHSRRKRKQTWCLCFCLLFFICDGIFRTFLRLMHYNF